LSYQQNQFHTTAATLLVDTAERSIIALTPKCEQLLCAPPDLKKNTDALGENVFAKKNTSYLDFCNLDKETSEIPLLDCIDQFLKSQNIAIPEDSVRNVLIYHLMYNAPTYSKGISNGDKALKTLCQLLAKGDLIKNDQLLKMMLQGLKKILLCSIFVFDQETSTCTEYRCEEYSPSIYLLKAKNGKFKSLTLKNQAKRAIEVNLSGNAPKKLKISNNKN